MRIVRILALLGLVLLLSHTAEPAAPAITDLRDVGPLRVWFQQHTGQVRLVVLLSPTCPPCIRSYEAIRKIVEKTPDPDLQIAVVWLAIGQTETRADAVTASIFNDGRVAHFWDPYRAAGETWQSVLKLNGIAWDVYLLYGPESKWNVPDLDPAPPAFWMHQLKDLPQAPRLDIAKLESKIKETLAAK